MKKQFKLGVIGCNQMVHSILKGAVLSDFLHEKKIIVSDVSEEMIEELRFLGVRTTDDSKAVVANSDFVLFAFDPENLETVVKNFEGIKPEKIISIIPNLKKSTIKNSFGIGAVKVARCAVNLPCSIGSGAVGVDMSDFNKTLDDTEFISNIFNCVGTVLSIDESKMDAVTGVSVNGPAYVFMFIDSLVDAGVKLGLTKSEAKILTVQTVLGAAEMVERDEQSLPELIKAACNGNNGIEAVKVFEENNFRGIISEAVSACISRIKGNSDK